METGTAFEPGAVVGGDFVVKKLLGEGGMGAVYTAEQTSTGKLRALKVMHKGIVPDRAQKRRFEQEAKVGSLIKSGHVVEVIAAGIDAERGLPFLVMELLDGTDLRKHLEARARLPAAEVRALFEQLCHGVAAAHAVDVVHRDLKPENIFLARSNRAGSLETVVKVLDFGIAKLAAETGTRATAAIGSPLWMAPEQTAPGPVTPAADVWALGLIAYELLTGEHFWRSASTPTATPMHLLREIVLDPIPPASERGGAFLPPGFDAWFARCIARDPAERFQDAGQLWQAMAEMLPPRDGENVTTDPFARTAAAPPLLRSDPPAALPVGNTPLVIIGQSFPPEPPPTLRAESRALARGAVWLAVGIVGLLGVLGGVAIGERHPENVAVTPPGTVSAAALGAQSVPAVPPVPPIPPIPPIPAIPPIPPIPPIPAIPPIPPIPAIPSVAHGKHVATDTADEPPPAPTSPLRDGFGNPHDPARQGRDIDAPRQTVIQGHHVRLFTRLVSNQSNVADPVVRSAIDYSSWEYERCYERAFGAAKDLPGGTVTVGFDIEQQLPRRARLESSTFGGTVMGPCVLQTLSGQTVNAAGPDGAGHVVYGFRYVVMD